MHDRCITHYANGGAENLSGGCTIEKPHKEKDTRNHERVSFPLGKPWKRGEKEGEKKGGVGYRASTI